MCGVRVCYDVSMPATVELRCGESGCKYRVIEADDGTLVRGSDGSPVDGGGHGTKSAAESQARAINASKGE